MAHPLFLVYTFAIWVGDVYIFIGKLFYSKLDTLFRGRKSTWKVLENFSQNHQNTCWIHCASLGEFEQGRPLIEKLKLNHPELSILLSFYSPSGFEIMKNYDKADAVIYLPSDLPQHNDKLIRLIKPKLVIFVKYEFWWNLIGALQRSNVPVYLISAVFRSKDYFFHPICRPFRDLLSRYATIFVQDDISINVLSTKAINNTICAGDTRIDRVIQRSKSYDVPESIHEYCGSHKVIIYGSVWKADMDIVKNMIDNWPEFMHIIAPHDVSSQNIKSLRSAIPASTDLYSDDNWSHKVLFIDNIGMLSGLYKKAHYAYIGGGFQKGIHNILEPAVFGIPVFFGPNFKKFNEAVLLDKLGLAFPITEINEMTTKVSELDRNPNKYKQLSDELFQFFAKNKGATNKILEVLDSSESFSTQEQ